MTRRAVTSDSTNPPRSQALSNQVSQGRVNLDPTSFLECGMLGPEWLAAAGGFLVGASIIQLRARIRTARLGARLEAVEFEATQLREELARQQSRSSVRST